MPRTSYRPPDLERQILRLGCCDSLPRLLTPSAHRADSRRHYQHATTFRSARAPRNGHITVHICTVADSQNFMHPAGIQSADFPPAHTPRCTPTAPLPTSSHRLPCGYSIIRATSRGFVFESVQQYLLHNFLASPISDQMRFSRDRQGVLRCIGKEIAQTNPVDSANIRQGRQRRNHPVGFKFRQQRGRQTRFCGEPRERQMFLRSQCA